MNTQRLRRLAMDGDTQAWLHLAALAERAGDTRDALELARRFDTETLLSACGLPATPTPAAVVERGRVVGLELARRLAPAAAWRDGVDGLGLPQLVRARDALDVLGSWCEEYADARRAAYIDAQEPWMLGWGRALVDPEGVLGRIVCLATSLDELVEWLRVARNHVGAQAPRQWLRDGVMPSWGERPRGGRRLLWSWDATRVLVGDIRRRAGLEVIER